LVLRPDQRDQRRSGEGQGHGGDRDLDLLTNAPGRESTGPGTDTDDRFPAQFRPPRKVGFFVRTDSASLTFRRLGPTGHRLPLSWAASAARGPDTESPRSIGLS